MTIRDILDLDQWPDLQRYREGYLALHQPKRGKFAYDMAINDPLPDNSIEKIVVFGGGADAGLIRELYGLCNGMRAGKLGIYGLLSGPWGLQQPWDINVPNCYGRPPGMPESHLIVASQFSVDATGQEIKLSHIITADAKITVVPSDQPATILRAYHGVTDWLRSEVARALGAVRP